MRRFIVPRACIGEGTALLEGELYRHMVKVLRLKPGACVLLADGGGTEYTGVIDAIEAQTVRVTITEKTACSSEAAIPRLTLYQGMPKADKLEYIIQKCTELGAAEIVPFVAARSVVKLASAKAGERVNRWQRIADEASRQSGRASVAHVAVAESISDVLQQATHSVKLLLWEEERTNRLKTAMAAIPEPCSVAVLVGPEGGFAPQEAAAAMAAGFIPVSLGPRILRTETAGIAIVSILQFFWGDMG